MVHSNLFSLILLPFTALAASHGNQGNHLGLGLVKQAFEAASIPSALSINFKPKALLDVTFPGPTGEQISLQPGIHLPVNVTAGPPIFGIVGNIGSGPFVILAVDANPPPPFIAQIRHFLGPNFFPEDQMTGPAQARALVNRTTAISEFIQPAPLAGSGTHRYIFLLFNQPEGFNSQTFVNPNTTIFNFSLSAFIANTRLGDPIAGNFMLVAPDTFTA